MTRDDVPTSSLNRSFSGASNLFATSTISNSPPTARSFSPSLSQTPSHKLFAPGATPEPSRVQREKTAQPTPRGMVNRTMDKDPFTMRIEEPPKELSGDALIKRIPDGWDPRGSIYADQFLQDSCPPEYDDEQRRQWFCVLDLRRLKYSANELFARKGWKLNIMNFAKEYEKSRSIILLHYGLYEFRNVKPSKELVRKWRREHGLPPLEDDEPAATPSKPLASKKKRKASEDASDETQVTNKTKRRATDKDDVQEATATIPDALPAPSAVTTPSFGKNKRKASDDSDPESQPNKKPSSARTLFENAAKKATTTPSSAPPKASANVFAQKPTNSLMQSVLKNNAKTDAAQQASSASNIFGHLSDSSAKNSGQEADAESSTDSESEDSPDEPAEERPAKRAAPDTIGTSSNAGTRESTPGRSLFDRVSTGDNGEPARAETLSTSAAPKDQTWNPSTTPLKFAPSAPSTSTASTGLFGSASNGSTSNLFAPKTAAPSNPFGAPAQEKPVEKEKKPAEGVAKDDGESDKENDSNTSNTQQNALPDPNPTFGGSLFQPKPAESETAKEAEPVKAAATNIFGGLKPSEPSNLFGAAKPTETSNMFGVPKPADSASEKPNLFGAASKPADGGSSTTPSVMKSSTLFGQKPAEPEKPAAEPQKPLFGAPAATDKKDETTTPSLFGAKSAETSSNIFGNGAGSTASKPLFGASTPAEEGSKATTPAAPIFSFGKPTESQANGASQPAGNIFGAPKSPPATKGPNGMFDGSPMKQDDKSPAKPAFGANNSGNSTFSFGQSSATTPAFGANPSQPAAGSNSGGNIFGGANTTSAAGGSGGFNFNFGGGSSSAGANPFSGAEQSSNKANSAPSFSFGAGGANTSAPSTGSPFQFGGGSGNSTPTGGIFGAGQANGNGTGAPSFGAGPSNPSSGSGFTFGAGQSQPLQPSQGNNGPSFLAPPAASSTGTNTPSLFGGGSSLATTPARGTPEPSSQAEGAKGGDEEEGEKQEQIDLAGGSEEGEETLHEVRAKALKFITDKSEDGDDKPKAKSPWKTEGLGQLRLLKNKDTNAVRLLLRAEPRGNVAMNRLVLPDLEYKADRKYLKITTSNDKGDGLETWMIQVKTEELSKGLAKALEENKAANKK